MSFKTSFLTWYKNFNDRYKTTNGVEYLHGHYKLLKYVEPCSLEHLTRLQILFNKLDTEGYVYSTSIVLGRSSVLIFKKETTNA